MLNEFRHSGSSLNNSSESPTKTKLSHKSTYSKDFIDDSLNQVSSKLCWQVGHLLVSADAPERVNDTTPRERSSEGDPI